MRYVVLDDRERFRRVVLELEYLVAFVFWQCFEAKGGYAQQDDGHRDDGHEACPLARLRILEEKPERALQLVRGQDALLLWLALVEAFVFAKLVEGFFAQLEEFYLFGENVHGHVDGPPKTPIRLIIVQDGVEAGPIAIEKVLVAQGIKVSDASLWISQKSILKI